jgi:HEAT repeat protein
MLWWKLQRLKSRDPKARRAVIEEVVATGSSAVIEPVCEALKDENPDVRVAAARGLGALGDDRGVLPLMGALKDPKAEVRAAAAQSLRIIGDTRAIDALTPVLHDADHAVRWQAASALNALGWRPANDTEFVLRSVALGQHDHAASYGSNSVDVLINALKDPACPKRNEIAVALGRTGDQRALKPLEGALRDDASHVRVAAIEALSVLGASQSANALFRALKDSDHHVRAAAIEALGRMGDARIVDIIADTLLFDSSWDVRKLSVEALGRIHDDRAVDLLSRALQDRDHDVRQTAASALGQLMDARAIGSLVLALKDENSSVRQAAKGSLRQIDKQWEISPGAQAVIPQLEAAVNDKEYWVAQSAADTLAKIHDACQQVRSTAEVDQPARERLDLTVRILAGALRDIDRDLRQAAVEALGRIGDDAVVPPLVTALDDQDEWVGRAAALALNHLNWEPAPDDIRRAERLKTLMLCA